MELPVTTLIKKLENVSRTIIFVFSFTCFNKPQNTDMEKLHRLLRGQIILLYNLQ